MPYCGQHEAPVYFRSNVELEEHTSAEHPTTDTIRWDAYCPWCGAMLWGGGQPTDEHFPMTCCKCSAVVHESSEAITTPSMAQSR